MGGKKANPFLRADRPPPPGSVTHTLRIGDKERFTYCIVSPSWYGYYGHYEAKQTYRCNGTAQSCQFCARMVSRRWYGFLQVCNPDGRGTAWLQLTALAAERLEMLKGDRPNLTGILMHVYRERGVIKSPLKFDYVGLYRGDKPLPKLVDPIHTLQRMWKTAG